MAEEIGEHGANEAMYKGELERQNQIIYSLEQELSQSNITSSNYQQELQQLHLENGSLKGELQAMSQHGHEEVKMLQTSNAELQTRNN